eukprot:123176_1
MAREIIHVSVGQCGTQIGQGFWDSIRLEHRLDEGGIYDPTKADLNDYKRLTKIGVYFRESSEFKSNDKKQYVARACLIDLEPGTHDVIQASHLKSLYDSNNFCFGASGAGNNFAKGHYTEGAELIDEAMDIIRRETELCECLQGFQLTHSIGGGTGSGMGTLVLMNLRDNYWDKINTTYTVFPSPKVSDVVVEPYNATLAIHQLLENADKTFVLDNEALFHITHNVLKQKEPRYKDLNWVISMVMSGTTASLRFSGELNRDMRRMGVNLVPFPRLHFFSSAAAPLFSIGQGQNVKVTVEELTQQMWSSRNCLANMKYGDGKFLTAACVYRGNIVNYNLIFHGWLRQIIKKLDKRAIVPMDIIKLFHTYYSNAYFGACGDSKALIPTQEVEQESLKMQQTMSDGFIKWIPHNIKTTIVDVAPNHTAMDGTCIANTTAIKAVFQRISAQFAKMYKRKAFLGYGFKGNGMDEMEFQEADKNVRDLITEFQDKEDAVVDLESSEESDKDF